MRPSTRLHRAWKSIKARLAVGSRPALRNRKAARRLHFEPLETRAVPAGIEITEVPTYGVDGILRGLVTGVNPADYRVAPYIQIEGAGWWTKPTLAMPTVPINTDGTFEADVATGGIDNRATIFCAALIPANVDPPIADGDGRIPADLVYEAIDCVERFGRTIEFAGRTWGVKEAPIGVGPGNNRFSFDTGDVFVDTSGLHLTINFHDGVWWSTEVVLLGRLGYGTYSVQTNTNVNALDPNVTAGYFTWDSYGDDDTIAASPFREIDFEDSRWGSVSDPTAAQMVVQPFGVAGNLHRYAIPGGNADPALTRFFRWEPTQIEFFALQGHHGPSGFPPESVIDQYLYLHDPSLEHFVPTRGRESFRINLWLNSGATAPSDGQPVELVVTNFAFEPLNGDDPPTPPTDANTASNQVAENAANGTPVGITALATDPEGATLTYSLTDDAGGRFTIDSSTGVVTVANGSLLDFESNNGGYSITVAASDGAQSSTADFTIDLTNAAPSAPTDSSTAANRVPEGAAHGASTGIQASSLDPAGGQVTFSLSDSAGGRFAIDAATGVVTVDDGSLIDFEASNGSYSITVQASDGNLSSSAMFSIEVSDQLIVTVGPDPLDAQKVVCVVDGTAGNDVILFQPTTVPGRIEVLYFGVSQGIFGPIDRIVAHGNAGDDSITVSGLATPAWLYGDAGDDSLTGANGTDVLIGGNGDDTLKGRKNRDLLIGGVGAEGRLVGNTFEPLLHGGKGQDILIAGTTDFDGDTPANQRALFDVMAVWKSTSPFASRVDSIQNVGVGVGSATRLNLTTVHDDSIFLDVLRGGMQRDWYFLNVIPPGVEDMALGSTFDEIIFDINDINP